MNGGLWYSCRPAFVWNNDHETAPHLVGPSKNQAGREKEGDFFLESFQDPGRAPPPQKRSLQGHKPASSAVSEQAKTRGFAVTGCGVGKNDVVARGFCSFLCFGVFWQDNLRHLWGGQAIQWSMRWSMHWTWLLPAAVDPWLAGMEQSWMDSLDAS
jgi:hypothetical protein